MASFVIPAHAGIHGHATLAMAHHHQPPATMDPGVRRDDEEWAEHEGHQSATMLPFPSARAKARPT
ncbi:hypothetical protein CP552_02775 [Sphingomonas melonis]|nr:hypothetical protein CP552_02775 [Sphingomonas melonis]MBI0531138.1 hypothetical protein [Sphingomonas sp. TX0522]